jgi:serine/threonine protein kinase
LNFFRKEVSSTGEQAIARLIQQHPHPNIVKVYRVTESSIDIEEVQPFGTEGGPEYDKKTLIAAMTKAKDHLQSLGVMYIDWKPDNIGLAADGTYKLYDFDASGVTKPNKKNWSIRPPEYWKYRQAIASGIKDPLEMNNFAFDIGLVRENYKPVSTQ